MGLKEENKAARRRRNADFVAALRRAARCEKCGQQPIEWHSPDHIESPSQRIGVMIGKLRSLRAISKEVAKCVPLCRRCHMIEDGRLAALKKNQPRQKGASFPPKQCSWCRKLAKPLRRGLCAACDQKKRRQNARDMYEGDQA
jgi:hypothetical protein